MDVIDEKDLKIEEAFFTKGYIIGCSETMNRASRIVSLGFSNLPNDKDVAIQAEKDGINLIKDLPITSDDKDFGYFIDTPENRKIIKNHLFKSMQ